MSNWELRKLLRSDYYNNYVKGWKHRDCLACNGSGYYDNTNSPKCSSCNGTGREKYKPKEVS